MLDEGTEAKHTCKPRAVNWTAFVLLSSDTPDFQYKSLIKKKICQNRSLQ